MKVNIRRAQAESEIREAKRAAADIFASMVNANLEAETVVMIAAKRHFGLGEKRMREFMAKIKEVKAEFEEYHIDEIFGIKAQEEFREINIDILNEMSSSETLEQAVKMYERQVKPNVSYREAAFMQDNLKLFKQAVSE